MKDPAPKQTRKWVRNPSDEAAVRNGCIFSEKRGKFVCDWVELYCRLYEGHAAGKPLVLLDWARDATMRMFGWLRWSNRWGRWVRRFSEASIWVAKKNGKSPTLAAWGMYLLCGDGEPGQKVFFGARDGQQAREIAGKHAIEMLAQSQVLSSQCTVNRTLMQITHEQSRSILRPLSSANSRTQESKEGINGSVLIDETHVCDRDFIRRISRAGLSRSQPFRIEVSTAGNNPDGYGRERFDRARRVEQAEPGYEDDRLFVAIHAAPQDVSDEELDADPLKYGRMANPAMGVLIDPEEYLRDYRASRSGSLQDWLDFKMYRLNVWQKGSNPWLREGDWGRCRRDFAEDDLAGMSCVAGLDLARTKDMSALTLVFNNPDDGEACYLLPHFWIPRDRARELASLYPLMEWERAGFLTITPGATTPFGVIEDEFSRLSRIFDVEALAYDPRFAEDTTARMEEQTGVERVLFVQNDNSFALPTEEFERLVIAGKLWHNGHPVLSWQAGHAHCMKKVSKAKRVVKPSESSTETVDGIVAAIMALGVLRQGDRMERPRIEVWGADDD
jgi:phage terminase large subunit-like protein